MNDERHLSTIALWIAPKTIVASSNGPSSVKAQNNNWSKGNVVNSYQYQNTKMCADFDQKVLQHCTDAITESQIRIYQNKIIYLFSCLLVILI